MADPLVAPGQGAEGGQRKRGTGKMKPKFTCGALDGTTAFADVPLAATTWVLDGAARGRTGIGVDSCHEEQEKDEKAREGQETETAARKKEELWYSRPKKG